jgi:hypothetical protein
MLDLRNLYCKAQSLQVHRQGLEPIREVWIYEEAFAASRPSMMRARLNWALTQKLVEAANLPVSFPWPIAPAA